MFESPFLIAAAIVFVGASLLYGIIVGKRNAAKLDNMISELDVEPDKIVRGDSGDLALCWVNSGKYFVYLNTISGTSRRIEKQDVHSIEVQENGLTIRHLLSAERKKGMGEEITESINDLLPGQVKDKIERLEVTLKTKDAKPPMGYSIPVVEFDTRPNSKNYISLRDETVATANDWRSALGLS